MTSLAVFLYVFMIYVSALNSRQRYSMNFNWKFHIGSQDLNHVSCNSSSFTSSNVQCSGLIPMKSVAKNDINGCANACCANPTCALFQISGGNCSIGDIISIYDPLYWVSTCQKNSNSKLYSRANSIPDTNPNHFIATGKNFNDSSWPTINLPHDYIVNGTVNPNSYDIRPGSHGYLRKNTSWYRKYFSLPLSYENNTILFIDFDGIFRDSVMFINGHFLGNHSSGYTSFRYYLNPIKNELEFGDNSHNILSVFVDATADEGWWYEGGGIYRNVWFNKVNKIYFEPNGGIYLPTTVTNINNDSITGNANLIINATINNKYNTDYIINLKFDILKPDGSILKRVIMNNVMIKANNFVTVAPKYSAQNIELWSLENAALYKINCTIYDLNNNEIDFVSLRYGYRKVVFDVNNGLYLNNKFVKMKGICNHQDFGGTGVATPPRINRFRVEYLKNMGANSWRMSHNPPNPELLDFADEYGMLIWDENRHFGDSVEWMNDQRDMILRDRNHPSIVIWSMCNELGCMENYPNQTEIDNVTVMFKNIIQKYDGIYNNNNNNNNNWGYNRPITAAMDSHWGNVMSKRLDIQGINYNYQQYEPYHSKFPNQSMISSECGSGTTDRNEYVSSAVTGHVSAYTSSTTNCQIPEIPNYIIGSYEWTGFDYKGEPGPYKWPTVNSHFGINDIIGYPKDLYWYYKSVWFDIKDEVIIHIVPNTWNNDTQTNPIQIRVYTNCKFIELFINNKSISNGKKETVETNQFYSTNVKWEKGQILCNCYDSNDNILGSTALQTTNDAHAIILQWEYPYNNGSNIIIGDGQDVALINVYVVDNNGMIVPNANNTINFSVDDKSIAFILGVGNGDSACHERDKSTFRSVYHGKARVLIQSMLNKYGKVALTAKSDGLVDATIEINVQQPINKIITV